MMLALPLKSPSRLSTRAVPEAGAAIAIVLFACDFREKRWA